MAKLCFVSDDRLSNQQGVSAEASGSDECQLDTTWAKVAVNHLNQHSTSILKIWKMIQSFFGPIGVFSQMYVR